MRVFIYGIFEVCIVPQLLLSYFRPYIHPHFHTYSITCSKELTTLSMLLPVVTTTDRLHSWIFDTPLSSATTGYCVTTTYSHMPPHLSVCARVVAAMSPLQGVVLNLQMFTIRWEPQCTQGPSPTQQKFRLF